MAEITLTFFHWRFHGGGRFGQRNFCFLNENGVVHGGKFRNDQFSMLVAAGP
ncbi:hypothetical protein JOF48_001865 [Arthrobacter stackebrandtii]|uniref:Uncharacterized protein n=1 Tax=Arthrobacter stackebrandtii TaxID=272161 RepID=A0ABS4YW70_9MICC|nr:hypothetical protein [Arthrobacter stackebrandtii]MBP2413066.1 hypothetical protein [Arthrobacter stackebrandtii]